MKYAKLVINRVLMILIVLVLLITSFSKNGFYTVSANEQEELFPFRGNKLQNPYLRYGPSDTSIPNWVISSTNNILSGEKRGTISKTSKNGFRDIGMPNYLVGTQNNSDTSTFKSKSYRTSESSSNAAAAFMLFGQTMKLQANREYYFRAEIKSSNGNNDGVLNIYPGDRTSGPNVLASQKYSVGNKMMIVSLPFTPTGDGNVTVSLRHFANAKQDTHLEIHRMGFFLKDDYLIQEEAHALFNDSEFKELVGKDTAEIQKNIDAIRSKITASDNPYAEDVKEYVNGLLNKAQTLLDQAESIEASIKDTYENFDEKVLKGDVTQDTIDELKKRIEEVSSPGLKEKLTNDLKEVERVYDLQELKPVLKEELEKKANDAIKEIEDLKNVPESEKQEKIEAIQKELENGKKVIDDAKTREDATDAKDNSSGNIDKIISDVSLVDRKNESKSELDKKAEDAKKEIDTLPNLTEDEKQKAKDAIDQKTKDGKDAIDQGTTPKDVEDAKNTTDTSVKETVDQSVLQDVKNKAKKDLEAKADETKKAIDTLPGISQEAKDKAKGEIENALNKGLEGVESGESVDVINQVVTDTKTEMNAIKDAIIKENDDSINALINDKKAILNAEAEKAKETIGKLENVSQTEKDDAKKAIDRAVTEAANELDKATTPSDIDSIYNQGKGVIDKVVIKTELADAKIDAINALQKKSEAVRDAINSMESLTDDEKNAANNEINQTLEQSIQRINQTQDVNVLPENLQIGMDELDALLVKYEQINSDKFNNQKENLKTELDKKAEDAKKEIDTLPNLTEDEKQKAKDAIDQKTKDGKDAIDQGTTPKDVEDAKNTTDTSVKETVDQSNLLDSKNKAKKDLEAKADETKKAIDALPGISQEAKDKAKGEIDNALNKGLEGVETGKSVDVINKVVTDTKNEMDAIKDAIVKENNDSIDALINDKKSNLDAEAKKAKEVIDKLENLSQTEKDDAKKLIDETVSDTSKELDKATTPSDINTIYNQGKTNIGNVVIKAELDDAKTKAIKDLNAKAEEVRKLIADKPALSDQQRSDANDEINKTLAEAIKRIEDTTVINEVPENLKTGIDELDAIEQKYEAKNNENLDKKKEDSKSDLDKKSEDAKKEIDKLPNLTDDEKQKAKDDIDQKNQDGKGAIDQSNDPKEIDKVIDTTDKGINDIVEDNKLLDTKNKAKDDLDKKAEDAKKEIDKLPNLTEDEKQKAKDDVDQKTKEGKDAIDQGTTPKDVEDAKNTTNTAVKDIVDQSTLQDAKNKAKKDLEAKADETKKAIDVLPGLSQEIKNKAKGEIENALSNGLQNIETGKSIEDVNKVVSETKTEMDAIKDALIKENFESLEKLKDDKKANLNAEAEKAKETIDKLENLSQADKDKAKKVIDQAVNDASKELDKATTPSDINTIYNQGKTDIGNVVVKAELDDAKIKAVADLKAKADEVRKQIADKPSLSNQQRKEANDEINKTLTDAIKRIEDTTVITDVPENLKTGIDELNAIEKKYEAKNTGNLDKKKEDSKSELDKKAEDAKKEIDKLPNLTDEEKNKAKDEINQKNQESKDAIDQSNDPKEIDKVIDTTDKGINDIVDDNKLLDIKNKAKDDLDKKAEDAKKEIDKLPNLTDEEKTKAKEEIEQKNQESKDAIDQSKDSKEIDKVIDTTEKGINDIVEDNKLLDTKNKAKDDLDKKAEDAKKEIDKLPNLTDDEKQKAKDDIDQKTKEGKNAIDQGTTPKDVENAKNTTDTAVKDIVDQSTLQDAKNKAKKDLEAKADETKKAIDALPGLSQEAKDKAKAEVDKVLKEGLASIDSGSKVEKVNKSLHNSMDQMDKIVKALSKPQSVLPAAGITASSIRLYGLLLSLVGMLIFVIQTKKNRYNH
ncbi:GA module-containing protein [Erysipelothrix rhusiopathiae]|uniref:DUF1542 domain-containing protein n=1 Tax=Erysipelothrix rhusiopathiae TaxID=1648 RepID=UPI000789D0D8|nr:DUF1542 domain-containing protein [Erysipelothrix rhusiopathiae]AMS10562.1 hypothetical protein A2I91_01930 [Erysipelothrix rhusiopathiae]AOO67097.1 hypothetical protein BC346_01790 [Erysipelothrix rhusiopathiae]AWU42074.1 DUF1542 domain-containing protein [Erysipelothrix rhusiopathiae]MDV7681799.1 GA module-containing protein [Erysipelothrix rhusiopathiae]MDV7683464.1 GA module-containing protein [Erysipelothrix rhusiopathiae]